MAKRSPSDHLANVPLFAACSKKELAKIAKATDQLSFPDGHVLMHQEETAREAFILIEGNVTVKRNNRKVADLGPGSMLGELGLLDRGPRTADVVADGPITVLVLAPREFSAILDEVPSLNSKLLKALAARIRELDKKNFG